MKASSSTPEPSPLPDTVRLGKNLWAALEKQARRELPMEACALLSGRVEDGEWMISALHPVRNQASDDHRRAYAIGPRDYLRVERQLRGTGATLLGVFHSHPEGPAIPSATDGRLAWPNFLYLIGAFREEEFSLEAWLQADSGEWRWLFSTQCPSI